MICFICKVKVENEEELYSHLQEVHADYLKERNFTPVQANYHYVNRFQLKQPIGVCACGTPKKWIPEKSKYEYYCGSDECRDKMNQLACNNNMKKFGVEKVFELADIQHRIMEARGKSMYVLSATDYFIVSPEDMLGDEVEVNKLNKKIELYKNKGASQFIFLSKVEEKTLLKLIQRYDHKDIEAPMKEVITYTYPGTDKVKNHIPDILVKPINLIISCKDSILHPNRHPGMLEDRFKNLFEYQSILNTTDYNYFQIEGEEEVANLNSYLDVVTKMHASKSRYLSPPKVDVFVIISETVDYDSDVELNNILLESSIIECIVLEPDTGSVLFKHNNANVYSLVKDNHLRLYKGDVSGVIYKPSDIMEYLNESFDELYITDLDHMKRITEWASSTDDDLLSDISKGVI